MPIDEVPQGKNQRSGAICEPPHPPAINSIHPPLQDAPTARRHRNQPLTHHAEITLTIKP